jgi:DNA-binding CsgD family transcriptional regulator
MGIDFGKIINNINRAEVYYDQKQYTQAAQTLNLIENEIKSFNLAEINKGFYELSYRVHDALGNKNIANTYFRYYTKNKETYIGDLPRSVISEWELSRERERGSQLTDKHNLIVYQQKQSNYYYAFIISLLSLGVVSIYFLMNKKRLKLQEFLKLKHQKMAFDLELKSKALLTESLKNISIQQSKSLIKADLVDVLKELPVEYRTKFNGLKGKLEATGLDAFLVDFENRFIGVYEVFYDKLKAISSDLTPNELIICAMLRLNYTSKEISYLTNRTPRTIENNRSIIRKKLNLETDVNLQQFIVNL